MECSRRLAQSSTGLYQILPKTGICSFPAWHSALTLHVVWRESRQVYLMLPQERNVTMLPSPWLCKNPNFLTVLTKNVPWQRRLSSFSSCGDAMPSVLESSLLTTCRKYQKSYIEKVIESELKYSFEKSLGCGCLNRPQSSTTYLITMSSKKSKI